MRIPRAVGIVVAVGLLDKVYQREHERDADTSMQNSAVLANDMATYLEKTSLDLEKNLEYEHTAIWELVNNSANHDVNPLDTFLAKNMSKEQFVAGAQKIIGCTKAHPWPSERIAYLREWAAEAEAKKQQEETK
jgi:hypothetical protein